MKNNHLYSISRVSISVIRCLACQKQDALRLEFIDDSIRETVSLELGNACNAASHTQEVAHG